MVFSSEDAAASSSTSKGSATGVSAGNDTHDAVSALVNLGYSRSDAFMVVNKIAAADPDHASVDILIREGLKELARS